MAWSQLEIATDSALAGLLLVHGVSRETSDLIGLNLGIKEKATIIACLAHAVHESAPSNWLDGLLKSLNRISNELRTQRNRLMHDTWAVSHDGPITRTVRTPLKVSRPQSRTFSIDMPSIDNEPQIAMSQFVKDCLSAGKELLSHTDQILTVAREAPLVGFVSQFLRPKKA